MIGRVIAFAAVSYATVNVKNPVDAVPDRTQLREPPSDRPDPAKLPELIEHVEAPQLLGVNVWDTVCVAVYVGSEVGESVQVGLVISNPPITGVSGFIAVPILSLGNRDVVLPAPIAGLPVAGVKLNNCGFL